jgi:hypothetical protein
MIGGHIMRRSLALFSLALVVLSARPSNAQDVGHVGLTMAFPAAVGVIWQATDRLAIRPDFQFSQSGSGSLTSSQLSTAVGVSALFYVRKWDNLRAYLSPRFGYQHSSVTLASSVVISPSADQYSYAGSFGAEYQLHRRFAVFGEAGIAYSHTVMENPSGLSGASVSTTGHIWGTRAGIGAIVYF